MSKRVYVAQEQPRGALSAFSGRREYYLMIRVLDEGPGDVGETLRELLAWAERAFGEGCAAIDHKWLTVDLDAATSRLNSIDGVRRMLADDGWDAR